MKELISLLSMRERRTAAWVGAVLGTAACLLVVFSIRARSQAVRTGQAYEAALAEAKSIGSERDRAKTSREAWADAQTTAVVSSRRPSSSASRSAPSTCRRTSVG